MTMLAEIHNNLGGLVGSGVVLLLVAMVVLVAIAAFVFWLWMLISAVRNQGVSDGSILYFFIGHPKRHAALTPR